MHETAIHPRRTAIHPGRSGAGRFVEYGLMAAIFLGSLFMWTVLPFWCLWLVSLMADDATNFLLLLLFVTPLTMMGFGLLLARLNGLYLRVSGAHPGQNRSAWLKSLTGERTPRRPPAVLEVSMTISVIAAILLMLVFFFFFAESYNPAPIWTG
jgi:ABC-type multidrug transport system permease subunit